MTKQEQIEETARVIISAAIGANSTHIVDIRSMRNEKHIY